MLYRTGTLAFGWTSSLVFSFHEGRAYRHLGTKRQAEGPTGPSMFAIRSLLRNLASTLGPDRFILACLDDSYSLSMHDGVVQGTLDFRMRGSCQYVQSNQL